MLSSILTVIAILLCRKTAFMVAGVLVCLLLCHQKRPEKQNQGCTCVDLHRSTPAAVHAGLSPLLSLPHTAEHKQTCDPPVCNHHKNTSLLCTARISLLILNKSQPRVKSSHVKQPSQPLLPGLEMQKVAGAEGNGNH